LKTAVIICNMGGPEKLADVKQYLTNIFEDPAIINYPVGQFVRNKFAAMLAKSRVEESQEIYKKLGGKTPLLDITNQQAAALEKLLNSQNSGSFSVLPAMRYWHPFIEEVWQKIASDSFDKIVFVSLYPFYSYTTSGSLLDKISEMKRKYKNTADKTIYIDRFGKHPKFIEAMANQINKAISKNPEFKDLLLSAHSIPLRSIKKGDPYSDEIEQTVNLLKKHLSPDINVHLAFQSKVGPVEWLGPATQDKITELAQNGVKKLLAFPLGFVADNSETIYEIGMLYGDFAHKKGITDFIRIDSLNADPIFIDALKMIVLESLNTHQTH
jgi:protoporphyrin/coproporphyrin ferrochelatase